MFKQNDRVVYPGYGVAVIVDLVTKFVGDKKVKFFKLKFLYKDMMVLVPMDNNAQSVGLRYLCSKQEIEKAFKELHKIPKKMDATDFTPSSWNKRNKSYQLKIQGGNICDIAAIYRDLMYVSRYKELSFGEKNLLHIVEELLLQEILVVKQEEKEKVIQALRMPFKQFSFPQHIGAQSTSSL